MNKKELARFNFLYNYQNNAHENIVNGVIERYRVVEKVLPEHFKSIRAAIGQAAWEGFCYGVPALDDTVISKDTVSNLLTRLELLISASEMSYSDKSTISDLISCIIKINIRHEENIK